MTKKRDLPGLLLVGNGIRGARQEGGSVIADIGSGAYRFAYAFTR